MNEDLVVKARVTTPSGWLDLMSGPYHLSADALVESGYTWRRNDVTNPFVDGAWTVSAVRENVTEMLDVWVRCDTTAELAMAVKALQDVFGQLNYGLELTFDNVTYYYKCYLGDLVVKSPRELRFARMAQVTVSIPRHPTYEMTVA